MRRSSRPTPTQSPNLSGRRKGKSSGKLSSSSSRVPHLCQQVQLRRIMVSRRPSRLRISSSRCNNSSSISNSLRYRKGPTNSLNSSLCIQAGCLSKSGARCPRPRPLAIRTSREVLSSRASNSSTNMTNSRINSSKTLVSLAPWQLSTRRSVTERERTRRASSPMSRFTICLSKIFATT